MWHPLRLAEDFAMADVLTGGRVRSASGRGYHTREVETFGAPLLDQDANRELFEEQVEIIFKAFNAAVVLARRQALHASARVPYRGYDSEGSHRWCRGRAPPVECWQPIQARTPRGLDFMAKHGIKGLIGGGAAEGGAMRAVVEGYRDAQRRAGRELRWARGSASGSTSSLPRRKRTPSRPRRATSKRTSRCSGRCVWCAR